MHRYRIVYVERDGDPCHWQLQRRVLGLFWRDACGAVSSATTAGHEMMRQMGLWDHVLKKAPRHQSKPRTSE